jgi:hypothetical protein
MRIWEAQKHTDPTDPDSDPNPQHWLKGNKKDLVQTLVQGIGLDDPMNQPELLLKGGVVTNPETNHETNRRQVSPASRLAIGVGSLCMGQLLQPIVGK